jgi:STE24 endopeptidase
MAVNDLAAAYQPRRVWGAAVSITWNLLLISAFLADGAEQSLYHHLTGGATTHGWLYFIAILWAYLAILFAAYALLNYPIELWFGYLEERQFGLAKDGIRAWSRDWLVGVIHHGTLFCLGSSLLMLLQVLFPRTWLVFASPSLLVIFLSTSYFSLALLPHGLFQIDPIDPATKQKLEGLLPSPSSSLPSIYIFTAPNLRDFSGGLVGLGNRQAMLLSRSTISAASDTLLRFVLLHDLGHRRYHHLLLSTLAGWAWAVLGLCASHRVIAHYSPQSIGHPPYLAWLALTISLWMAAGEPILAYLGRRLEYQADRFYLRHGGTLIEMRAALEELSRRNLARTEGLRRRHTIFHPLPSVWNRLHAAGVFVGASNEPTERKP